MKKIVYSFLALSLISTISFADCSCSKIPVKKDCDCNQNQQVSPCEEKTIDKCSIEDDEYSIYNQCFCNNQFKKLKQALCLTSSQECEIDKIYQEFKSDIENYHSKYRAVKNRILEAIECNECYADDLETLKDIKKDMKERCKCFKKDIKAQLCKDQYKDYRKFFKTEKKKMKKIVKYGKIIKFPCTNCNN